MTRFMGLVWLSLLLTLLWGFAVYGNCDKTLKVGVYANWPPYTLANQEQFSGIDVEATRLILAAAGYCTRFITVPSSGRGLTELKMGRIDVLPAASYTPKRETSAVFSAAYREEVMRLFWRPQPGRDSLTLTQLMGMGMTLAVSTGAYYGAELERLEEAARSTGKLVEVSRADVRFDMLSRGRVDMVVDDALTGDYLVRTEGYSGIGMHPYVVHRDPIYLMVSRLIATPELMQRINRAIAEKQDVIRALLAVKHDSPSGHL